MPRSRVHTGVDPLLAAPLLSTTHPLAGFPLAGYRDEMFLAETWKVTKGKWKGNCYCTIVSKIPIMFS